MNKIEGTPVARDTTIKELVSGMKNIGLQASNVAHAVDVIQRMKKNNATIFLAMTSNMISSGIREIIVDLVKRKFIDAIITTAGAVEEDVMKTLHPFELGSFDADDKELHKKGINRIGNIFVPNTCYEKLEDFMLPFLKKQLENQRDNNKLISPQAFIENLGNELTDENSLLYHCAKNNIPVFCPAPTDGALGLNIHFFKQKHPEFGIDVTGDMQQLSKLVLESEKTGAIILGGGLAKHHTIGINILRDGLDYAVYISTGTEYDGSLSGARPREAISWSKLAEKADHVFVEGDASIIFPLVIGAILE